MIFDDTFVHEAFNPSALSRVVLFVDFERPLRSPGREFNKLALYLLSKSPYVKETAKRARQLMK